MAGPFIGKTMSDTLVPIPSGGGTSYGTHGPANGSSLDGAMEGGGIVDSPYKDGLCPTISPTSVAGGEIGPTVRRVNVEGAPGEGAFEAERIPGSGIKLPKPGY